MIRQVKKMTAQFCEPKEPSKIMIDEYSPETILLFSLNKELSSMRKYLYKLLTGQVSYYNTFGGGEEKKIEIKRVKQEVEELEIKKLNALYIFNQKIRAI